MSEANHPVPSNGALRRQRNPYELGLWILAIASITVGVSVWVWEHLSATVAAGEGLELLQTQDQYISGLYELATLQSPAGPWVAVGALATAVVAFGVILAVVLLLFRMVRWAPR